MKELEAAQALAEWRDWYANGEPPAPSEWAEFDRRMAALLESLSAPPTEDEREAIVKIIDDAADRWKLLEGNHAHRSREARDECMNGRCDGDIALNGYGFTTNTPAPNRVEFTADAIIASPVWRNRHRQPITDEIRRWMHENYQVWPSARLLDYDKMLAFLEAAESTRTASTEGSTT